MKFFSIFIYIGAYALTLLSASLIAAGSFWLSEIAEEYATLTRKVLCRTIYVMWALHGGFLVFDGFPFIATAVSCATLYGYYTLVRDGPVIIFKSKSFFLSILGFVLSNVLWIYFFASRWYFSLAQGILFMALVVWLVPYMLFVSMETPTLITTDRQTGGAEAAQDSDSAASRGAGSVSIKRTNMMRSLLQFLKDSANEVYGRVLTLLSNHDLLSPEAEGERAL